MLRGLDDSLLQLFRGGDRCARLTLPGLVRSQVDTQLSHIDDRGGVTKHASHYRRPPASLRRHRGGMIMQGRMIRAEFRFWLGDLPWTDCNDGC